MEDRSEYLVNLKIYGLIIINYIGNIIVLMDGFSIVVKVIAAILTIGISVLTVLKIKQDLKNKKEQESILKLQRQQEEHKLFLLMEEIKLKTGTDG